MIKLFDTAKGEVTELTTRTPGEVSMYVCGGTVYADPHIGHGRFSLVFDILRRYLEWTGLRVHYVSNITDIEDKIIKKAVDEGVDPADITTRYEATWYEAMDALGVRRPDADPHATAYVEQMVSYIGELVDRGKAYETGDGVYLIVESVEDYGLLARQSLDSLQAGAGGRDVFGGEEKRSPLDFALWKKAKPGEPTWDSPWGPGRPGWHIECTVMALDHLDEGFDLHGGGVDLAFPHHENERAQAVAAGKRFATHWMHNGMVVAKGGRKMGKSEGNAQSLLDLLADTDPRAYRLLVLMAHYRTPVEVTPALLQERATALASIDRLAERLPGVEPAAADPDAVERFRAAMDDDLNTPVATAVVFDLVRAANTAIDAGDESAARRSAATAFELLRAVGLEAGVATVEVDDDASALAVQRDEARAAKDWAKADALRDELVARGWKVEDTPAGTKLSR